MPNVITSNINNKRALMRGLGREDDREEKVSKNNLILTAYFYPLDDIFPSEDVYLKNVEKLDDESNEKSI